jgi:hypothetical protein
MTQHIQVSLDAAEAGATWSRDGRTLYFLGPGGTLISVSVITFPELRVGKPAPVAAAPTNIVISNRRLRDGCWYCTTPSLLERP